MSNEIPRVGMRYLAPLLPTGFERYYTPTRAGAYYGLKLACPVCHDRPPKDIKGNRRWRWLSVHQAVAHQ